MFNLSKIINNMFGIKKTAARESELAAEREKQGLSSGEEVGEAALQIDRKDSDDPVIEKSLEAAHSKSDDAKIIESSIESHKGIVGRQPEKTDDYGSVPAMSVASEMWDSRAREMYKKELAKISSGESVLDKYIGDRNNIDLHRKSMPLSSSGIANDPDRFESFGSTPVEDAKKNMKTIDDPSKVKKIASSIMDIDAMRFAIEYNAAKRGYHTEEEENTLSSMRAIKKQLVQEMNGV